MQFAPNRTARGYRGTLVQYQHILTNTGNHREGFYFHCTGRWTMCPVSMTVEAGQTVTVPVSVNIPGGAISGEVDVAVITAILTTTPGAEVYPSIRRQVVDTTTVGLSCGVNLEGTPPRLVYDPSRTTGVTHWVKVINTSSWTNTFRLSYNDLRGFSVTLDPPALTLGPDRAGYVAVRVKWNPIPQDCVNDPLIDYTSVTAVSQFPECTPPVSRTVVLETWLSACPLSIMAPSHNACGCSWETVRLNHTLENRGNYGREINLFSLPEDWPYPNAYPLPADILLMRGESALFTNNIAIPDDALCGAGDRIRVVDPGSIPVAVVTDTVTVGKCPVTLLEPDGLARVRSSATQSTTVTYNHVLTNSGNCTFTFDLRGSSSQGWPVEVVPTTVYSLPPGGSVPVSVRVTVPPIEPTCANAVVDSAVVTATPRGTDLFFVIGAGGRYEVEDSRSLTGPRFAWVDISATGTDLGLNGDDVFGSLPLGFDFPFYGHVYNTVFASSNGLLTFGAGSAENSNAGIPWPAPPNNIIAPFWDNQRVLPSYDERVYYQTFGDAPNRYLVVQWRSRPITDTYPSPLPPPYEYQAILYEDGTIVFQYKKMSGWVMGDGRSATVGIENESGAVGTSYSVNRSAIADGLAIRFTPLDGSVEDRTYVNICEVDLEPSQEATALPGEVVRFRHVLTNTGVITDSYTLSFLDASGWSVDIAPLHVGPLPPGETAQVMVALALPPRTTEVLSGTVDTLFVTASSRSISFSDTVTDTTTVGYLPAGKPRAGGMEAAFGPQCRSTVRPGGMVTCTHILTNTGNYTETFDLTTHSMFAYASIVSPISGVVGPLRPGEAYGPVVVNILLPPQAALGAVEHTEVLGVLRGRSDWQVAVVDLTTAGALTGTRHVAPNGLDENNNCLVPLEYGPCRTPQHAVDEAYPGDLVKVARGVYNVPAPRPGANRPYTQVVYLDKEIKLQGGYSPVEWSALPDPVLNPTVLDAWWGGRVVYIASGISPTIEGFHIRGGRADMGAGLYVAAGSSPVVRDNMIYENQTFGLEGRGGGVHSAGSPVLDGNTFYNNAAMDGAAIHINGGKPAIWNNLIYRNAAGDEGGGLYISDGDVKLWNNTFYSNTAMFGGGIGILGGRLSISNTIFSHNANYALYKAGGVVTPDYNDWWLNTPDHLFGFDVFTGEHSILEDPLFVSSAGGNFRLRGDSPCVDAGDPRTVLRKDRDGNLRPLFDGYDLGAYEYGLSSAKLVNRSAIPPGNTVTYTIVITRLGSGGIPVSITDTLPSLLSCEEGRLEGVGWASGSGQYLRHPCRISWSGVTGQGRVASVRFTARVTDWLGAGTIITNVAWVNGLPSQVATFTVSSRAGTRYVAPTGNDALQGMPNSCLFPTYPCRTIQYAAGQAVDGDTVRIATGVYTGSGTVLSLTHRSLTIVGGYSPTLPSWTYNPDRFPTRLDARGGTGLLLTGPATVTLAGLQVVNGAVGITATLSSVVITRCRISSNSGDGVHITGGALRMERTWVHDNGGDGVAVIAGDYRLDNNVLVRNSGAGLRAGGGGVGRLRHNTLADNTSGASVGSAAYFTNTIVAGNGVGVDASGGRAALTATLWYNNAIESIGSVARARDVVGDPAFVNAAGSDYHLKGSSAAINRGIAAGVSEDIDGDRRPVGGKYDLGADESPLSLEVAKQARPDPVAKGGVLTYTIRITNSGLSSLRATIVDRLPGCLTTNSALTWNATIPAGGIWTYRFTATVGLECGWTLTNVVAVNTAEGATGVGTAVSRVLCPRPLEGVRIVGPTIGSPGVRYRFTAVITPADATEPVLYGWAPPPEAGQGTPVVTYTWSSPGAHHITVSPTNRDVTGQAYHTMVITDACLAPLTGVGIAGPSRGYVNIPYTFTALITPANATPPIRYTWAPTRTVVGPWDRERAVYRWSTPGTYAVTLTVANCGGVFTGSRAVAITPQRVYLPVVLRAYRR
ncbi:MAG: right-handed parallel beta-helix repeat-containing protein [Anaerolineae bacterium]|nr:right-handed parallel beta-helix repeat-containing protein [Anaerolineae bacterium]